MSIHSDDSSDFSDNSDVYESDAGNVMHKIRTLVDKNIGENISKFYFYNQKSLEELKAEDFDLEELEQLSQDEKEPTNLDSTLKAEDDKFESFKLARKANMQMGMMIESFSELSKTINHNFSHVHRYIKDL